MINFCYITKQDMKEHSPNCLQILDHPYRMLIVGGYRSGKTNSLSNPVNHQPNNNKTYLYAKDPNETKD